MYLRRWPHAFSWWVYMAEIMLGISCIPFIRFVAEKGVCLRSEMNWENKRKSWVTALARPPNKRRVSGRGKVLLISRATLVRRVWRTVYIKEGMCGFWCSGQDFAKIPPISGWERRVDVCARHMYHITQNRLPYSFGTLFNNNKFYLLAASYIISRSLSLRVSTCAQPTPT